MLGCLVVSEMCIRDSLGFVHECFFITEPFTSECGRFEVDPMKEYGLTQQQVHEMDKFNQADPAYLDATS